VKFLREQDENRLQWTPVLAALARELPRDAYLTSFQSAQGHLRLVGRGASARSVATALERADWFTAAGAPSPIGGGAVEFTLDLIVTPPPQHVSPSGAPPSHTVHGGVAQ
jgi:hypothetical protein